MVRFFWCETGRRRFVDEHNFTSSIVAEFNTYKEAKKFGKTRYPDDEDYGVFGYEDGVIYRYSDAFGQPLQRKEIYPDQRKDWELV